MSRSVTEAALYLHEQTYLDLQDLMAARLLLGLWDELSLCCQEEGEGMRDDSREESQGTNMCMYISV
jgi:hypothetical protein